MSGSAIPVVSHDTAIMAAADLLRIEMEDGENSSALADSVRSVARENPEIVESVVWMTSECDEKERMSALLGMAVTYRALKAQLEVDILERLTV